ncbi:SPARC-related modular calcium-binding protein 2 isoform X2 [Stomoxys calcitrans]|uniref:SPARC-related modular calcium-binding protein 2 isoform X2 n=1 Tax=Stomoxys calcitrans TaxID=35570 RepID=UPI0027E264B1|nr:SPARC-related modular calcium-binding protein 2 isoform X2 [Stomoxys calcitrans]
MILRSLVVFVLVCIHFGNAGNVKRTEMTISECAAKLGECDESKGRPVCGTDDQTYPTRCHLLRVQCSGHQVSLKYRGACKACNEAREYALKHRSRNPPKFIPRCKLDGTYALIQCLTDSGCWCSDITGTPIENTSVRTGKPKCREFSRRSPSRNSGSTKKRPCTQEDRAMFNSNLINVFQSEYVRSTKAQYQRGDVSNRKLPLEILTPPNDADVMNWKFSLLDVNHNQMLDKSEYRELKKLVKRAVKPKRCGRAFGKFCDVDNDERLSRTEWNSCLSKDGVNHSYEENESNAADDDDNGSSQHSDSDEGDFEEIDDTFGSSTNLPSIYRNLFKVLNTHSELSPKESDIESDCLADRATALEELKKFRLHFSSKQRGNSLFYVPDCTPDGRYQRVQCYNSTPYCWCVNEDTGKDIPDTLVKDRRPQCDSSLYTETRQMKGCPDERKAVFLKDLKEFLKTKIIASSHVSVNTTIWNSEDERIATLSFVILDKNKNKAWERKEWKTFRELVNNVNPLRKCGRKMPRYCDVNSDKQITLTEWLSCLQAQKINGSNNTSNTLNDAKQQNFPTANNPSSSKPPKLSGSNPLEQYLKD